MWSDFDQPLHSSINAMATNVVERIAIMHGLALDADRLFLAGSRAA